MTSNYAVAQRWANETRKPTPNYLRPSSTRIRVGYRSDQFAPLYSYGEHFELARWVPQGPQGTPQAAHTGFWLLNGDSNSVSTARHQSEVRAAVTATGEPILILPFTALESAGIDKQSIVPIEITGDRREPFTRTGTLEQLPGYLSNEADDGTGARTPSAYHLTEGDLTANPDGTYTQHATRHVLGESVFTATYRQAGVSVTASFLSGFDAQERTRHYFLAQLPQGTEPTSVKDAFEILRPQQVMDADKANVQVTRQGDVFAVPTTLTTRELHKLAPSTKQARLLDLSHVATEVIETVGATYARGTLTHRPLESWRRPEHKRQTMGDGKVWHLIVKNTVPMDSANNSRAWSQVGNVD